jgi:3-hydroxyisobutyrate dehydrogenase
MTIALFGTGLLGSAIATRLLERGHVLRVWNRSPKRCAPLQASGAISSASPAEAARGTTWLISVLSDGPVSAAVLLDGVGEELRGRNVLQMGTIGVQESVALAQAVTERGGHYLEAPVLGSRPEALAGQLQLMAGGPEALLREALPLLRDLAPEPRHLGPVGSAMAAKLALNQLIASLTHAFSLSLHLVQRQGVALEPFLELLRGSALYAPTFDKKLQRELDGDYGNPNFPTAHLRKDLGLFMEAAAASGLEGSGLAGLLELLQAATAAGLDELDYSALHALTAGRAATAEPH